MLLDVCNVGLRLLSMCVAPEIGETLLGDEDVEVVLSVVDMAAERHNGGNACTGIKKRGRNKTTNRIKGVR